MTLCSKPGCTRSAAAVLGYDYAARVATLRDPVEEDITPHVYVLCASCADKLRAPKGWTVIDERAAPPLFLDHLRGRPHLAPAPEEEVAPEPQRAQLFFGHSA